MSEALEKPQRMQLKRTKGFNLQAVSMALNGLPAVKCARPGPFGNPWRVGMNYTEQGDFEIKARGGAVEVFKNWLKETSEGRALARRAKRELAGKNLACFCPIAGPCHCDILLSIANPE